ncbi:hypothetical protein JCM17846_00050 [Iodidimonas nitroreducens]|uniref:SHSP domain-containing protein n=1 Tax=Iodidimonas nitroreducens TaxID=1236968 RepID=A0A5A7N225_9PROT|nr:Hsp20 family protein [Iodidimonas nitroreducens]GAK34925.1 small heat shock protein IbpA [alpha proteobacterium Q-1]GER02323.1 hypothetical protein JCM17846_00050 [Iodidimonas nitroreducens]
MSRLSVFNSPLLLGFDHIERMLDTAAKSGNDGYPPYNIEHLDDRTLRITLAVAGFTTDDLDISVESNQLVIRGRQNEETERTFLHRGIATRQFQRKFVLAEGMEVSGASLDNGLLNVDLNRPEPEKSIKTIEIRQGDHSSRSIKRNLEGKAASPSDAKEGIAYERSDH